MQTFVISDVTLREIGRAAGVALSFKESLEIAKALDRLRPYAIELPAYTNQPADALLIKSIASAVRHARIVLPAALSPAGVREAAQALACCERATVMIAAPVSAVQMEYQCHKKPDAMLSLIDSLVRAAVDAGVEAEFAAEDATRAESEFLERALSAACEAGASAITLCDTAGTMLPDEFGRFVRTLRERVPGLKNVLLGAQCSDNLHMAAACAMAGGLAGATLLKASVPKTGCLSLAAVAEILRARGVDLGLSLSLSTTELTRIDTQIDWILHARRDTASPYEGGSKRQTDAGVQLGVNSTLHEITEAVTQLGYDLSPEDNGKVYEAFRLIAAKKDVGQAELEAIVASAALQAPPAYTLESYVINSGNVITSLAHIKLVRDGKTLQGIGLGDGPVDASFLAIEQIIGHHYELDDFQIQAVTEGREAMGSALVRLRSGGRLFAGKGISTDIIGASIRAYINALNKIVYEEARA